MQLIVISSAEKVAGEAAIINGLFQAGLSRFHLRKPGSTVQQIRTLLDDIDAAYYSRIALHQHHEAAQDYGINRLHYTEQIRGQTTSAELNYQQANGYTLSTSIHDLQAIATLAAFDYTFFGPVFNSLSKPGYTSSLPLEFKLDKQHVIPKVMAIGGIGSHNLSTANAMGFDGVAVLGTIWNQPGNAVRTFQGLQEIINKI